MTGRLRRTTPTHFTSKTRKQLMEDEALLGKLIKANEEEEKELKKKETDAIANHGKW